MPKRPSFGPQFLRRSTDGEPRQPPETPEQGGLPLSVWLIVGVALAVVALVLIFH